jgi:pSer/pThr/pTyr-binding forkhead associated (FHA) protein
MISRCHARLKHVPARQTDGRWEPSHWVLSDLDSTNGCLWNGVRVKESKLSGKSLR